MCVCVGWCVRLPDVLSLIVSPHVCLCWMACPPSRGLVSPSHPFCPIERIVSHCLPTRLPVLDGGSAFPDVLSSLFVSDCLSTCVPVMVCLPSLASPLSAIVSHCLPTCACVGWCVCLPEVFPLVSDCLPTICVCVGWCVRLRKVLSLLVVFHRSLASMVCPPFQGLVSPGPPLLPILSHCLPACVHLCWMVCPPSRRLVSELSPIVPTCVPVLDGVSAFPKSCLPLSPFLSILVSGCLHVLPIVSHCLPLPAIVSHCLPTCACVGWSAFPKCWFSLPPIVSLDMCDLCCMVRPLSRGLVSPLSPFLFPCVGWCVHLPDVLSPLSPLSPSLSSFLSPSLSPNLSFFLFPFVVGGLILHFFKQCTVGVGFLKVSALVLDGVSAFPRSCLLYCLPVCLSSCFPVAGSHFAFFPKQCTVRGS